MGFVKAGRLEAVALLDFSGSNPRQLENFAYKFVQKCEEMRLEVSDRFREMVITDAGRMQGGDLARFAQAALSNAKHMMEQKDPGVCTDARRKRAAILCVLPD